MKVLKGKINNKKVELLPSTDVMREEIGIMKATLINLTINWKEKN